MLVVSVIAALLPSSTRNPLRVITTPVAAIRLTMNALSSAGGKVTATILQAGIG